MKVTSNVRKCCVNISFHFGKTPGAEAPCSAEDGCCEGKEIASKSNACIPSRGEEPDHPSTT